jgi:HEAT repeat protein
MFATPAAPLRHPAEAELLLRAADGDPAAAGQIVGQLGSGNHWLRQIISEAIQDCAAPRLWQSLLSCLALRRWNAECPGAEPSDGDVESRQRTIAAITELFVKDAGPDHAPATRAKRAVLAAALDDPRPEVARAAACLLGQRGELNDPAWLIDAVRHGEIECRLRAVAALGRLQDPRGGPALIEALACEDERLHWEAARALADLGRAALPALSDALRAPAPHVRWHAVRALGQIGDVASASELAQALGDDDYGVRWAAAEVLARFGAAAVPPILERLARQPVSEGVRAAAYHALHRMQPAEVQERLQPVLSALRGPGAADAAPAVAYRLLHVWES